MQETQVQSLGQEDPLRKEMATHSSILTRKIPWTEEPGGLQSMGSQRVRHDQVTEHNDDKERSHCTVVFTVLYFHSSHSFFHSANTLSIYRSGGTLLRFMYLP